jgi:hypothetical protein
VGHKAGGGGQGRERPEYLRPGFGGLMGGGKMQGLFGALEDPSTGGSWVCVWGVVKKRVVTHVVTVEKRMIG